MISARELAKTEPGRIDLVLIGGRDKVFTGRERRKYHKKLRKKNKKYGESFYGLEDYKLVDKINNTPFLELSLENIFASESSGLAAELGLEGAIGKAVMVCDVKEVENMVRLPKDASLKMIESGPTIFYNVVKGFCGLFDDGKLLPDENRGFFYLKGREMQKKHMSWKIKASLEFYAILGHASAKASEKGEGPIIPELIAMELIRMKKEELEARHHYPKRLELLSKGSLAEYILGKDIIARKAGGIMLNEGMYPGITSYFSEYHRRNEKEACFVALDTPFYNPGLIYTIHNYRKHFSGCDIMLNLVPEAAIEPYISGRRRRPYMVAELDLRTANIHIAKPSKIGNVKIGKEIYGKIRMLNLWNALWNFTKLTYDSEDKRFNHTGFRVGRKLMWNRFRILNYLKSHPDSTRTNRYRRYVSRYWEYKADSRLSDLEATLSSVLEARIGIFLNPYAGLSFDLDSKDVDKRFFEENYSWINRQQHEVYPELKKRGLLRQDSYYAFLLEKQNRVMSDMLFGNWSSSDFAEYFSGR